MKIERVNDYQIRCTLTKEDLASRELKISELAYGTDKAKELFRDMMQQANYQFGFDAEDIPLMIEAVPINSECIVLIITKVEDPEELDTRFANFSPSVTNEVTGSSSEMDDIEDDISSLFKKIKESEGSMPNSNHGRAKKRPSAGNKNAENSQDNEDANLFFLFSFDTMHDIMKFASLNQAPVTVNNTLYKSDSTGRLFLLIQPSGESAGALKSLCTQLSEYGRPENSSSISIQYLDEHYKVIIRDNAIQKLTDI